MKPNLCKRSSAASIPSPVGSVLDIRLKETAAYKYRMLLFLLDSLFTQKKSQKPCLHKVLSPPAWAAGGSNPAHPD